MAIPKNITTQHIEKAIEEIVTAQIPAQRLEQNYSLISNGKTLPPKYVISIANKHANGRELNSQKFNAVEAKTFLIKKEFNVIDNRLGEIPATINVWIEKTIVKNRKDRTEGERALGKALCSPQTGSDGRNTYKNMPLVKVGDLILHLVDNSSIIGLSLVENEAIKTTGLVGTRWDVPSYLIKLKNYTALDIPVDRSTLLNKKNKSILNSIAENSEVFYNKDLTLRQGGYLSPCPIELLSIINDCYKISAQKNLPFIDELGIVLKKESIAKSINQIDLNLKSFVKKTQDAGLIFSEQLIQRLIASLCTKPFVILSGLSGSGKTKIAQSFVKWICENKTQYKIVPVGADWTNREPLLGYPNGLDAKEYITPDSGAIHLLMEAKKEENKNKPFFLILDEMNLSHVERYFADFLSVMETDDTIKLYTGNERESLDGLKIPFELPWPKNVFIIGTVNIDETTYMFSPKVLDRANVIEFRITDDEIEKYLMNPSIPKLENLQGQGITMAESFVTIAKPLDIVKNENLANELVAFFNQLKAVGAEFGYRSATEIMQLAAKLKMLEPTITDKECMDIAIMQKLLPKLHGSRSKLVKILIVLSGLCVEGLTKVDFEKNFEDLYKNGFDGLTIKYPISFEKLIRMYKNVLANGFTSYAEA